MEQIFVTGESALVRIASAEVYVSVLESRQHNRIYDLILRCCRGQSRRQRTGETSA